MSFLKYDIRRMTVAFVVTVMCLLSSCSDDDGSALDTSADSTSVPTMRALNVSTVVSDSGITRFRATTDEWLVFTMVENPYWYFPKGLQLERFNTDLKVEANVYCDTAHYDMNKKLWQLDGNVKVTNIKGERFETQQLFWDQANGTVYSDKVVDIHQKECVIKGRGFSSNETMTNYVIRKPEGVIPVNE